MRLKENWGKLKTEVKGSNGVGLIVPYPKTEDVDPSAKVTVKEEIFVWKVVNRLELPVIWFVAPKSMTHLEDDDIRHLFVWLYLAIVMIGIDEDFNDSWYAGIYQIHLSRLA